MDAVPARFTAICVTALALPAQAAEKHLSGAEIAALLPTIVAVGDETRQTFAASGATTYVDRGRGTYGTWRVEGDRYCSQWPPERAWSCYTVSVDEDASTITWTAQNGETITDRISIKE